AMRERGLRHANLVVRAGYVALEDGCVGGFVQRAINYNDEDSGIIMMGGHDAQSQTFRASEAAIRGFWKKYRALTGACGFSPCHCERSEAIPRSLCVPDWRSLR